MLITVSFLVALVASIVTVWSVSSHGMLTADHDFSGPQKFHSQPVPRVGGISIALALLGSAGLMSFYRHRHLTEFCLLLACAVPSFAGGLIEDVTKKVAPRWRILAIAVSALMGVWLLNAIVVRTSLPGLDYLLTFVPFAIIFTLFAVTGMANSINIIDGFNGLASMCVVIMLAGLAFVAFRVGDTFVGTSALVTLGAVLGFFVLNFPKGLIFLGDGGAYLLGFLFVELSILLVARNDSVSPLFPFVLAAYPVVETIFSIYRRKLLRGMAASDPDGIHLHSLIYRRLIRWSPAWAARRTTVRNSMTSPYLWLLCLAAVIPAVLNWASTAWLAFYEIAFVALYLSLYRRIVRFRTPKWMVVRG